MAHRLLVILLSLVAIGSSLPALQKRDATFESVRTRLSKSKSGRPGDPVDKYFHEAVFHPHYDGRFADMPLPDKERQKSLTYLVQSYFSNMNDIGIQTWIMHGTLMGWWWNRKILPWDSDLDVMIAESSMRYLSDYYNMTVHHFSFPDEPQGRDYLLEINPNWVNSSTSDRLNSIDARWIDMDAGLFIDITTLRPNTTAEAEGIKGMMMCKDKHHYRHKDIFPLRDTVFENILVKIPYAYADLLEEEYGPASLTRTRFANHHFESETMEWIPDPPREMRTPQRASAQKAAVAAKKQQENQQQALPEKEDEQGKQKSPIHQQDQAKVWRDPLGGGRPPSLTQATRKQKPKKLPAWATAENSELFFPEGGIPVHRSD